MQDARGVFKQGETPKYGRLHLTDLASRVPNAIAALSGGNFHYNPPPGEYYEWDGPHVEGDVVGETIVNSKLIAENPKESFWGAFEVTANEETAIIDTNEDALDKNDLPQFSLGGVPLLLKNGVPVTTTELGPVLKLKPKQASSPGIQFRSHINMQHARAGICKTKKGDHLLVMVEGRQKQAEGLRMAQFGRFLKSLGCEEALNLDGGGTADLVTKDKQAHFVTSVTSSDPKGKRPVATAIVITV